MSATLEMWTVYDHPTDYPEEYVARRWDVTKFGPVRTELLIRGKTLEEVRRELEGTGLALIPREAFDDPKIVETWM